MLLARISPTLSRHFTLSFIASGRSSGLHPVSSHSCCMYVRAGRPAVARSYAGVHRSTSLMSSSLLLQHHCKVVKYKYINCIFFVEKVRDITFVINLSCNFLSVFLHLVTHRSNCDRVQQEIPSEEASTLQIGSVAFPLGQCTSPQLHPCIRLFDQDGHQDSSSASL